MPWTADEFKARHNKALDDEQAAEAASIANDVLERTGNESTAIKVANARMAKKSKGRKPRPPRYASTGKPAY